MQYGFNIAAAKKRADDNHRARGVIHDIDQRHRAPPGDGAQPWANIIPSRAALGRTVKPIDVTKHAINQLV